MPADSQMNGKTQYMTAEAAGTEVTFVGGGSVVRQSRWTRLELFLAALCVLLATVAVVLVVIVAAQNVYREGDATRETQGSSGHGYTVLSPGSEIRTPNPGVVPTDNWPQDGVCLTEGCVKAASRLMTAMDSSVDPCDDFFEFACGSWNKVHIIPDDRASYNTFSKLGDDVHAIIKDLLGEAVKETELEATKKEKYLFASCMNETTMESLGLQPILALQRELGGWPVLQGTSWNPDDVSLMDLMVKLRHYNEEILVKQWVIADDKNSHVNIIHLDQPELGMPSRDYYHRNDASSLRAYEKYAVDVAMMLGAQEEQARADMKRIVQLEVKLAEVTRPEAERRDNERLYNRVTIRELQNTVPGFNWLQYLQKIFEPVNIRITDSEEVVVKATEYLSRLVTILNETDKRTLVNYMIWRILMNHVGNLPSQYRAITREYKKKVYGSKSERARWRECVSYLSEHIMGNAAGRLFLEKHFDETSKSTALEMIHNIRDAFYELLAEADWMDEPTRVVAREKAEAIDEKIGYAERILNDTALNEEYADVTFSRTHFFDNVLSSFKRSALKNLRKLRQPVDRKSWSTVTPVVVNAYYSSTKNQIMLPAGILQPPFYSKDCPKSMNYGGIGMVIGHEITHGFDDKGRQFDKDGNLIQWWDDVVIKRFKERAQCIIDQYSNFTVPEINMKLNGRQTLGENIADNGGIKEAFRAYRRWVQETGVEEPRLPGLLHYSHDQLFFINFAQVWCGTMRPQAAVSKVRVGPHSPGRFRVIGTLQNFNEFSTAFKCPKNSFMNPLRKCSVW